MAHLELDLVAESETPCALSEEELVRTVSFVLDEEGVTRPCGVSLSVVDDERMRELNADWRGIDRATDVLSLECERPDDPDLADGEPCELGDIVLAPAYIAHQAQGFGTTPANETRLLLVHGVLHLLGYDHMEEDEATVMEAREDELVARLVGGGSLAGVRITRHREDEDA